MNLPPLYNWLPIKHELHQAAQTLAQVRLQGTSVLPNALHYGNYPMPYGATTGKLNFGGTFHFDFSAGKFVYEKDGTEVFEVSMEGHNPKSVFKAVFDAFAQRGHIFSPNWEKATTETPFTFNLTQAQTYADVQWWAYGVLSRLKSWMVGPQTPIMLFAHGFDISTLWFVDEMDEHKAPHLNFGWSPGTPDVGQPYFYFYAYPAQEALSRQIPATVQWHTAWSTPGGIIKYDQCAGVEDPDAYVFEAFFEVYQTASALLRQNA